MYLLFINIDPLTPVPPRTGRDERWPLLGSGFRLVEARHAIMFLCSNLAHIQAENLQNVQTLRFWQKALGVNGLM